MGIFDKAVSGLVNPKKIDVTALSERLNELVQSNLTKTGHAQRDGWSGDGSWYVECLNLDCGFVAQGNRGGKKGCDKMAELHLVSLADE